MNFFLNKAIEFVFNGEVAFDFGDISEDGSNPPPKPDDKPVAPGKVRLVLKD